MNDNVTPVSLSFDRGTLLLENISRNAVDALFSGGFWSWDHRVGAWRCDGCRYDRAAAVLRKGFGDSFRDLVHKPPEVRWNRIDLPALRPEQSGAVRCWLDSGGKGVVVMPTGTGKTEVALSIMEQTRVSTLIVSPVRDLMYQWHRRILRGLGYDAGILGDSRRDLKPVTVTTYDSAAIHMSEIGDGFSLIVFDEVHHLPGNFYRDGALMCTASMRLGLTATPERPDGRHGDYPALIGDIVCQFEISDAKGKSLADYETIRIPIALSAEEQFRYDAVSRAVRNYVARKRKDDPAYEWKDLLVESGKDPEARKVKTAYYIKQSIEDRAEEKLRVLEDLFRLYRDERVIVFTGTNVMALEVSKRFLIPTLLSHSRKRERLIVLEGFASGKFPAIVANRVLDEGVDVPEAKVAVVLGGMGSTRQAKQRLGRILRRTGEARAVLYEVVCEATGEEEKSRKRRRSDAYEGTRHRRI